MVRRPRSRLGNVPRTNRMMNMPSGPMVVANARYGLRDRRPHDEHHKASLSQTRFDFHERPRPAFLAFRRRNRSSRRLRRWNKFLFLHQCLHSRFKRKASWPVGRSVECSVLANREVRNLLASFHDSGSGDNDPMSTNHKSNQTPRLAETRPSTRRPSAGRREADSRTCRQSPPGTPQDPGCSRAGFK